MRADIEAGVETGVAGFVIIVGAGAYEAERVVVLVLEIPMGGEREERAVALRVGPTSLALEATF